jgi:spermidine synthase
VYSAIGFIIALFMAGLASGAIIGKKTGNRRINILTMQVLLAGISLAFPLMVFLHGLFSVEIAGKLVLYAYTLLISIVTGLMYVVCTWSDSSNIQKSATTNYSADLIGSAAGALATTLVLLPLIGLINCSLVLVALNSVTLVLNFFKKKVFGSNFS